MQLGPIVRTELWSKTDEHGNVSTATCDIFSRNGHEQVVMTYELFAQILQQIGLVKDD